MINNHENIKNNSNKTAVYNTVISKHCCGVNNEKEGEGGGCCKEREGNLDIYKYVGGSKKVSHRPIPPKGDTCANKPHHW